MRFKWWAQWWAGWWAEMNKLKPLQIKNAPIGKHADGGGLYFVKTKTGAKWIYRYSFGDKRREMGLGSYPAVSLAEARRERDKWAEHLRAGTDPISERERQRQAAAEELNSEDPTLEDLALMTLEAKKAGLRGGGNRGRWYSPLKTHVISKIGKMRVSQITQKHIADTLRPIWKTKHPTAEKAWQRLRIIFKHGELCGYQTSPLIVERAVHMLGEVNHTTTHIEATDWHEIPDLYAKLQDDKTTHRALKLVILTAVRIHSARAARREEFDGDLWTVPEDRMKGREGKAEAFRVPLSVQAQELVSSWMGETDEDYLFSARKGKPLSDRSVEKALDDIEEDGRPHGLRTAFRSWVQDTEAASYDVAETALGHIIGNKVERSYARSDLLDQRRILMQKWADFVTGAEAKVVKLRG